MRHLTLGLPLVALGVGCLPTDTRQPPAEVEMTASSSLATREGVATVDGYDITFERVLASLGGAYAGDDNDVEGGPCDQYSSPQYTRLFDFVVVAKPEKVGLAFALGSCPFGFVVRFPNPDAIISTGATYDDGAYMRIPKTDRYATDAGISLYVIGSATRGDVTKRFAWEFRERIGYRDCWVPDGDTKQTRLALESGGSVSVNIEMQAEALFRDQLDPAVGMLRFQPFADADTNGDDEITLDELDGTELDELGSFYDYPVKPGASPEDAPLYCADTEGVEVPVKTLGDYAYCALAPSVARFQGIGGCRMAAGRRPRD
jgi:hypothetical protein